MPARVLFYVPRLRTGGIEQQLLYLVTHLDRTRFEPAVWCPGDWGLIGDALIAAGILVHRDPLPLNSATEMDKTIAWLQSFQADLFYSCAPMPGIDTVLAKAVGIPVTIARRDNIRPWLHSDQLAPIELARNTETDYVVACCHAVAELARSIEAIPDTNLRVIHCATPLPTQPADPPADSLIIGNVANSGPLKSQPTLVRAFHRILPQFPTARLLICGRPDQTLIDTITELKLQDRVTLTGEQSDTGPIYRQLTLYVQPSISEAFPVAILEAMAHGLPVIASAIGGIPESVQHERTGLLIRPADEDALVEALTRLLSNPSTRHQFGQAARARIAAHFTIEPMVEAHHQLFEEALR